MCWSSEVVEVGEGVDCWGCLLLGKLVAGEGIALRGLKIAN